jgi:hypothetical protein
MADRRPPAFPFSRLREKVPKADEGAPPSVPAGRLTVGGNPVSLPSSKEQRFRASRESLFFDSAQRKVTKRKGASPTQLTRLLIDFAIFLRDILVAEKNGAHPCAPPYGSSDICAARGLR